MKAIPGYSHNTESIIVLFLLKLGLTLKKIFF